MHIKSFGDFPISQTNFNACQVFRLLIKLMKGKALRKHSLHEKTAASVLLKRCHDNVIVWQPALPHYNNKWNIPLFRCCNHCMNSPSDTHNGSKTIVIEIRHKNSIVKNTYMYYMGSWHKIGIWLLLLSWDDSKHFLGMKISRWVVGKPSCKSIFVLDLWSWCVNWYNKSARVRRMSSRKVHDTKCWYD